MRRIVAATVIAAALFAAGPARANVVESKAYVGLAGEVTLACLSQLGLPDAGGVGGACFNVGGFSRVHILVDDALTSATGFRVGFYGPAGRIGDLKAGCGDATMSLPDTATFMRVFVGVTRECPNGTTGGLGTTGFITVVKSGAVVA